MVGRTKQREGVLAKVHHADRLRAHTANENLPTHYYSKATTTKQQTMLLVAIAKANLMLTGLRNEKCPTKFF